MLADSSKHPAARQNEPASNRQSTRDDALRDIFRDHYANDRFVPVVARSLKDKLTDLFSRR